MTPSNHKPHSLPLSFFPFFSPTPARGNANGISEFTKQKEKRGCYFLFFLFFLFQAGRTLACFSPLCFVAGPVVKLRLRRPRELGDRAFRMGASPPPEEELRPPQLLSKGNIAMQLKESLPALRMLSCPDLPRP